MRDYIKFPCGDDLNHVVDKFKTKWRVPQFLGAVDGCHIPICASSKQHTDYYNRKGWNSIIIQGLVDANYQFIDICIGWPGSIHDARVFAHSKNYSRKLNSKQLHNYFWSECANAYDRGFCISYADMAIMKPFAHNSELTAHQRNYNICRARIVVENAFGRLKAHWHRVLKRNDMHTDNIPHVIAATCVLHNICEVHHEHFNDAWLHNSEGEYDQPSTLAARDTSAGTPHTIRN